MIPQSVAHFLSAWTGPEVTVTCDWIANLQDPLLPYEEIAIEHAVDKRRMDYTAGRSAARRSMRALGLPPKPLLRAPTRDPLWPAGIVGTISHTDKLCVAMTAPTQSHWALGADVEEERALAPCLADEVFSESDRVRGVADRALPIHIFSIKEAIFKAYFPTTKTFLEFGDVDIEFGPRTGSFRANIARWRCAPPWRTRRLKGRYGVIGGYVVCCVEVRR